MPDNHAPAAQDGQEVTENLKDYHYHAMNLLDVSFQLFRVVVGKMQAEGIAVAIPKDPQELVKDYVDGLLDEPLMKAAEECSTRSAALSAEVRRLRLEEMQLQETDGIPDADIDFLIAKNFSEGEYLENMAMLAYRAAALKFHITQNISNVFDAPTEAEAKAILVSFAEKLTEDLVYDTSLATELAEALTDEEYWSLEAADLLDATATDGKTLWSKAVQRAKELRTNPALRSVGMRDVVKAYEEIQKEVAEKQAAVPAEVLPAPGSEDKQPKKKRQRKKREVQQIAEDTLPMLAIPATASMSWLIKAVNSGGQVPAALKNNRKEVIQGFHDSKTGAVTLVRTIDDTELSVTMNNPALFFRSSSMTSSFDKMFTFSMQTWKGQGYGDSIGFPLQSLIDLGIYSTPQSARKGVKDFIDKVTSLVQEEKKLKGKAAGNSTKGVFIYNATIKSGYVTLSVNTNFDPNVFAKYTLYMPPWSYRLSNIAFSLLHYIMEIARQEGKQTGNFSISINAIQSRLGLPQKEDVPNRKYREKIQDPIENAIEEIEMAIINPANQATKGYNIQITPSYQPNCKIDDFLNARLEITVEHLLYERLHEIDTKRTKHIEAATKKKSTRSRAQKDAK